VCSELVNQEYAIDRFPQPRTVYVSVFNHNADGSLGTQRIFLERRIVVGCHGRAIPYTLPPEFGNIVPGVFTPVLAKHSKSFSLIDSTSVGVNRMQRNFEPMRKQVDVWQRSELTDVTAKVVV